ncbi:hypothetical protein [Neomoorella mulderi]|uniref:Thymidylate synthase n=1 Tax=Moorella mulderi DSM 14980 TaxID=1122241 RepID=A0A151AYU6_9FIRM|nr:hypothetical protein [Moorella mulderi]KYH32811.1 thymidylate synthase [Moorella mulderi DSM 14980]
MLNPVLVNAESFQEAWLKGSRLLVQNKWELWNLIVHITNPNSFDTIFHRSVSRFAFTHNLLDPKAVAYTIFPYKLYRRYRTASNLFHVYNKPHGFYERKYGSSKYWGNYFRRMTYYEGTNGVINQLENIINAINNSRRIHKAAYTIVIQKPGGETVKPLGGPCLNYIAIQQEPSTPKRLSLLCVYRNHDFLERTYGNYWGLCELLKFIAAEIEAIPTGITCISSHAFIDSHKRDFKRLVDSL